MQNDVFKYNVDSLIERYPNLSICRKDILHVYEIIEECFATGHKLLIAGNGGSCADSEHIVGELMKGFKKRRVIQKEFSEKINEIDPVIGKELSAKLQSGLPAIALANHQGLNTAFINDVENGGQLTFAQQVCVYGNEGDVFMGISTSGNSKNVIYAAITAKAKGLKVVSLTGGNGGRIGEISDASIRVPSIETFIVQEYHLPIYHCLCLMLEERFFGDN